MKYDRLEFVEAVELLAQQLGLEVPREGGQGPQPRKTDPDLYAVLGEAERYYRGQLRHAAEAISYLKSRGLTGEVARDFGVGYAPQEWQGVIGALSQFDAAKLLAAGLTTKSDKGRIYDRFRDRVMFPIRDTKGRVIGFGGRRLAEEGGPKYLNSPETEVFHKGNELYGLYEARRALPHLDRLIVVEGYMDVVALAQFGVANAVATLGTATGTPHFHKLYRYVDDVVCCFDGDQAGRQAAWKALENALPVLNEHRQLKFVFLPDGEDPDTLVRSQGQASFQQFLDHAQPAMEFLLQRLSQGLDLESVDGRARLAGLAQPYLERLQPGILRQMLERRIHELTGIREPAQPRPQATPSAVAGGRRVLGLRERLVARLVRQPSLYRLLDDRQIEQMQAAETQLGLLADVVGYLRTHPDADTEELLARWFDNQQRPELIQLIRRPIEIATDDLKLEFMDGIARLLDELRQLQRREVLEGLRESQNLDELRKYVALQNNDGDYS